MSLFINNKWLSGSGEKMQSINPATEEVLWEGSMATENEINDAISAARAGQYLWSKKNPEDRLSYLIRFKELLISRKETFASLISDETGKLLWECLGEVGAMIGKLDHSLKAYHERSSEQSFMLNSVKAQTTWKAHGVVAVLGPFNFPGHLPNGHIIPALIAGNTVVFKPSELTSKTGEEMVRLWQEIGLPDGVINLVHGDGQVGKRLVEHQEIDAVFFTGSVNTGKRIMASLVDSPQKLLALEMGGNNPLIIHQCKDLEKAAITSILSAYISAGQRCTCARRLILVKNQESNDFLSILETKIKALKYAVPADSDGAFMGTLISSQAASHAMKVQKMRISNGGEPLIESSISDHCSALVSPGLIDLTKCKKMDDEECFAPLLSLIYVDSFD
jgi:succinylglutamic semialdehyde dehydrogenase